MDYRYRPQRLHQEKFGQGTMRNENAYYRSGQPDIAQKAGIKARHFRNQLIAPARIRAENKAEDFLDLPFTPSPPRFRTEHDAQILPLRREEPKIRPCKRELFGHRDQNRGIRKGLKMEINRKNKEVRDFLEQRKEKKKLHLPKLQLPIPAFLQDKKEKLSKNIKKLNVKRLDHHLPTKIPNNFKPKICSTPFKVQTRAARRELQVVERTSSPTKHRLDPYSYFQSPLKWEARPDPAMTQDIIRAWKMAVQPDTPRDSRVRPELAYTQDKMEKVREWKEKNQPAIPKNKLMRDVTPRDQEPFFSFLQPEAPRFSGDMPRQLLARNLRVTPELAVTQNKVARVQQWMGNIQPMEEPDSPLSFLPPLKPARKFKVPPELAITQDKMERIQEWKEKLPSRDFHRPELGTRQKYKTREPDWTTEQTQQSHNCSDAPWNSRVEPKLLLSNTFLKRDLERIRRMERVRAPANYCVEYETVNDSNFLDI